ncbi:MAG: succinate dehydrogenase cytochrome b subunit [Propionibacteriaceae bacterium]|nr:succinate dehydrogenase cytochrome b subunit [Propionibacteriaceae bacterium]
MSSSVGQRPKYKSSTGTFPGADEAALSMGHVRSGRVRKKPLVASWVLKVIMAMTGTVFALFVLVHMIGNLKVFTGAEHFNEYAHWLRTVLQPFLPYEGLLWILRIALIIALIGHVWSAALIWSRSRASRGRHRRPGMWIKNFTARTMPVTGIVLLGFITFHVLDLTTGTAGVAATTFQPATPDTAHAYENLVASMQRPAAAALYLVSMIALFLHLAHGLWTVVNDVGVTGPRVRAVAWVVGGLLALAIMLGNILIPVAVLAGVVS